MKRSGSPAATVAVLAAAGLLAALLQTLVIPLVPRLPALLDAAPTDASWVVTITLLTGTIVTPVSGHLGDLFGKRRVLLLTLAATTTGTVISALAGSPALMVIGSGLQSDGAEAGARGRHGRTGLTRGSKRLGEVRTGARRGPGAGSGRLSPKGLVSYARPAAPTQGRGDTKLQRPMHHADNFRSAAAPWRLARSHVTKTPPT